MKNRSKFKIRLIKKIVKKYWVEEACWICNCDEKEIKICLKM